MLAFAWILAGVTSADPPPKSEVVKAALTENWRRIRNRHSKWVQIYTAGKPAKDFPALDSPGRAEFETLVADDGRVFQEMKVIPVSRVSKMTIRAFDGYRGTILRSETNSRDQTNCDAQLNSGGDCYAIESVGFDMFGAIRVLDRLSDPLTTSEIVVEGLGRKKLLTLEASKRDDYRETIYLDPEYDYWPVMVEWRRGPTAKLERQDAVRELKRYGDAYYPVKTTSYDADTDRTAYYTQTLFETDVEKHSSMFTPTIPDGARVTDGVRGERYIQGQRIVAAKARSIWPVAIVVGVTMFFVLLATVTYVRRRKLGTSAEPTANR